MKIVFIILICLFVSIAVSAQTKEVSMDSTLSNDSLKIGVKENVDISFEYATSAAVDLTKELKQYLDKLVIYMKANPGEVLEITGHSDDQGTFKENQERSLKRAEVVAEYLVSKGIPKGFLITSGKGSLEPFASNKTEEGRTKNRRITLRIGHMVLDIRR
ncbi:MAG: OmpA family protein [bacterium]